MKLFSKILIAVLALYLFLNTAYSQELTGTWQGSITINNNKLPLVFYLKSQNSVYTASMFSPKQSPKKIEVDKVVVKSNELAISVKSINANYKGFIEGDSIKGIFEQHGRKFDLNLHKWDKDEIFARLHEIPKQTRPQDPEKPYPYHSKEISFLNKKANIVLSGTLTYPQNGNNFPLAILISGSGPQNRNEEILDHRPFLVLSDYLSRHGIAVLRYDDRGTAYSQGNYSSANINDFATDAEAALLYAKTLTEINTEQIGFIGHSEGGTIAFLLAAKRPKDIAFLVSLAGMSIPGDSLLKLQRYDIAKAAGISDEKITENEKLIQSVESLNLNNKSYKYINKHISKLALKATPMELRNNDSIVNLYKMGILQINSPELKSIILCDPTEALKNISCPIFALGGEKDLQVNSDVNLSHIEANIIDSKLLTTKKYPKLNHLFQHCSSGLMNEYEKIEETISEEVMTDIYQWVEALFNTDK